MVYVLWYMCGGNLKSIPPTRWVWGIELWLLGLVALSHFASQLHVYKNHSLTVKCLYYTLEMYSLQLNSMLNIFRHHSSMWKAHNFKGALLAYPAS